MEQERASKIAEYLLKIKAVKLSPESPFTWASGWRSPVYCDNRKILSFPEARNAVKAAFAELVREKFHTAGGVAGVATAGIAHGALLADELEVPFIYVRSKPKAHGLGNQIEGIPDPNLDYVVVEDLISTGGSSLQAVEALRAAGCRVAAVVAVFSYGFPHAAAAFEKAGIAYDSLTGIESLLQKAVENNYIQSPDLKLIRDWQNDPEKWSEKFTESKA